jgi:hypothetical protein
VWWALQASCPVGGVGRTCGSLARYWASSNRLPKSARQTAASLAGSNRATAAGTTSSSNTGTAPSASDSYTHTHNTGIEPSPAGCVSAAVGFA